MTDRLDRWAAKLEEKGGKVVNKIKDSDKAKAAAIAGVGLALAAFKAYAAHQDRKQDNKHEDVQTSPRQTSTGQSAVSVASYSQPPESRSPARSQPVQQASPPTYTSEPEKPGVNVIRNNQDLSYWFATHGGTY